MDDNTEQLRWDERLDTAVLLWSPYMAESERPQIFLPGDWIPYLRALAACRSREYLDWRAAHWNPGAPRGIMAS